MKNTTKVNQNGIFTVTAENEKNPCVFCKRPGGLVHGSSSSDKTNFDFDPANRALETICNKILYIPLVIEIAKRNFCPFCADALRQINEFHLLIENSQLKLQHKIRDIQMAIVENQFSKSNSTISEFARSFLDSCKLKFHQDLMEPAGTSDCNPHSYDSIKKIKTTATEETQFEIAEEKTELIQIGADGEEEKKSRTRNNSKDLFDDDNDIFLLQAVNTASLTENFSPCENNCNNISTSTQQDELKLVVLDDTGKDEINQNDEFCSPSLPSSPSLIAGKVLNSLKTTPPLAEENSNTKPKWIKPIAPKNGKSHKPKQFKQVTLSSMSSKFPKPTVDVSTLKEFRGGARSLVLPLETNVYPAKRKSDEMSTSSDQTDSVRNNQSTLEDFDPDMTAFEPYSEEKLIQNVPSISVLKPSNKELIKQPQQSTSSNSTVIMHPTRSKNSKPKLNCTEDLIKDFDKLPDKEPVQTFGTVRKKEERARLAGLDCDECRGYYQAFQGLESQMHPTELQRIKNQCSRHRSNRPVDLNGTPTDFWLTTIPSTEEAYRTGLIKIGVASPSKPRKRHDLLENDY